MDAERFDDFVKHLATRRQLGLVIASLASLLVPRHAAADDAPRLIVLAPPSTGPKLSAIRVEEITATSAIVIWDTDEAGDSAVEYGPTIDLGHVAVDPALVTQHRIDLNDLQPEQRYHYRIRSGNANGIHATRNDRTFVTAAICAAKNDPCGDDADCCDLADSCIDGVCVPSQCQPGVHGLCSPYPDFPGYCSCQTTVAGRAICAFSFGTNGSCRHIPACASDADCQNHEVCMVVNCPGVPQGCLGRCEDYPM